MAVPQAPATGELGAALRHSLAGVVCAITSAMEDLHPSAGVRILLELSTTDAALAHYRAAVYTPKTRFDYRLDIAASDGAVTIVESPSAPGEPFLEFVRAMARTLAKDALGTSPLRWPRRLLRWRDK
jgi:hypothetical protein